MAKKSGKSQSTTTQQEKSERQILLLDAKALEDVAPEDVDIKKINKSLDEISLEGEFKFKLHIPEKIAQRLLLLFLLLAAGSGGAFLQQILIKALAAL
jgi:hypothetical protein